MVRKDECSVRTIVVVVVHLPMLRRVLVEISMVRRDLCHFRDSSLAEHCFTHPFVSGDAPRFFLLRFSKSCSADRFPFRSRPREASSQPRGSGARTDVLQPLRRVRREARKIAAGIAKLPDLLTREAK